MSGLNDDMDDMPELVAIQLARMEGTLNLVADRVAGLMLRVDKHDSSIGDLRVATAALQDRMLAEASKAVALAAALKEADEVRRVKDRDTWSPFARVITVTLALFALLSLLLQVIRT